MDTQRLLVAIDGSSHSEKVVGKAMEFSRLMKSKVLLVHCHRRFSTIIGQPARDREVPLIKQEAQHRIDPYLARFKEQGIPVEQRLMEEPAASAITDIATIENCDLIIMGSRGLTNLASLIVGSVTSRVLQTAPCSVLVVK